VIEDAKAHGLILGQNGKLYDTKKGEQLPDGLAPMAALTDAELQQVNEPTPMQVVGGYVRRYLDMVALSHSGAVQVIGENGLIRDRPGFEIDLITRHCATDQPHTHDRPSVLMPVKGHWRVTWDGGGATLAPGDTMSVPEHLSHSVLPSMTGEAALYHIIATDDPAGPTWVA
jgi:mannose-6-phosphate isomerase-like protein (cupin superfamily)